MSILSQKLPMRGFIKNHNDDADTRYPFGVDVQYPEKLHGTHNDLPFSPERIKIRKGEKVVGNFHDIKEYDFMSVKNKTTLKIVI